MKKKAYKYILLSVLLLCASCAKERLVPRVEPDMPAEGIVLAIEVDGIETKAIELAGEDGRMENLIVNNKVDIFFFRDSSATASIRKRYLNVSLGLNGYTSLMVTPSEVADIFANGYCNVVVVANYDGGYGASIRTRGDLYAIELANARWSNTTQSSFIMRGSNNLDLIDINANTPATGTVKLKRVAAKISFDAVFIKQRDTPAILSFNYNTHLESGQSKIVVFAPLV